METHTQTEPRLHAAKVIAIAQEEWPVHCQCTSRTAPKLLCDAACPASFILQTPFPFCFPSSRATSPASVVPVDLIDPSSDLGDLRPLLPPASLVLPFLHPCS